MIEVEEKKYTVYMHTNKINNKSYIGITSKSVKERWGKNGSKYKKNRHFWGAIRTYGWDNFYHDILFSNLTKENACKIEKALIATFMTQDPEMGYNIASGGEANEGFHLSEETKKKFSEQRSGDKHWNFGKHWSSETKQKIAEVQKKNGKHKGENNPMYGTHRCGKDNPMYGKRQSDETRQKIREKRLRDDDPHKKPIICLDTGVVYTCSVDVEEKTGICRQTVAACCRHEKHRKTAGGYHWLFYSEYVEQQGVVA